MKLDDYVVNAGTEWVYMEVPGLEYVFFRKVGDNGFQTEAGNYDIHLHNSIRPIRHNLEPLVAQAILYHLLAGGTLDGETNE